MEVLPWRGRVHRELQKERAHLPFSKIKTKILEANRGSQPPHPVNEIFPDKGLCMIYIWNSIKVVSGAFVTLEDILKSMRVHSDSALLRNSKHVNSLVIHNIYFQTSHIIDSLIVHSLQRSAKNNYQADENKSFNIRHYIPEEKKTNDEGILKLKPHEFKILTQSGSH